MPFCDRNWHVLLCLILIPFALLSSSDLDVFVVSLEGYAEQGRVNLSNVWYSVSSLDSTYCHSLCSFQHAALISHEQTSHQWGQDRLCQYNWSETLWAQIFPSGCRKWCMAILMRSADATWRMTSACSISPAYTSKVTPTKSTSVILDQQTGNFSYHCMPLHYADPLLTLQQQMRQSTSHATKSDQDNPANSHAGRLNLVPGGSELTAKLWPIHSNI